MRHKKDVCIICQTEEMRIDEIRTKNQESITNKQEPTKNQEERTNKGPRIIKKIIKG